MGELLQIADEALTVSNLSLHAAHNLKYALTLNFIAGCSVRILVSLAVASRRLQLQTIRHELEIRDLGPKNKVITYACYALFVYLMVPVPLIEMPIRSHVRGSAQAQVQMKIHGIRAFGHSHLHRAHLFVEELSGLSPLMAITCCHKAYGCFFSVLMFLDT